MSSSAGLAHAASEKNSAVAQVPLMTSSTDAMARGNEMQVPLAVPAVVEMRVLLDAQNPEVNAATEKLPTADTVVAEAMRTARVAAMIFIVITSIDVSMGAIFRIVAVHTYLNMGCSKVVRRCAIDI